MAPGSGACWRQVPLPTICTSRPEAAACSMTLRIGRPTSDGTRIRVGSGMVTVLAMGCAELLAGCDDGSCAMDCGGKEEFAVDGAAVALSAGADGWLAAAGAGAARSGSSAGRSLTAA